MVTSALSTIWRPAADSSAVSPGMRPSPASKARTAKIEHRLFSFITRYWRGRPLTSFLVIGQLIANTTTEKGLEVQAELDQRHYPTGGKVTDKELSAADPKAS